MQYVLTEEEYLELSGKVEDDKDKTISDLENKITKLKKILKFFQDPLDMSEFYSPKDRQHVCTFTYKKQDVEETTKLIQKY